MKFVKLKVNNFKPYFNYSSDAQEVILYDVSKKGKNVTVIVGPNESGKTSISEAILWCIYGKNYFTNWDQWINDLAIELNKSRNEDNILISVELEIDMENGNYKLIRNGSYSTESKRKIENSEKLEVIMNGEPLPKPEEFINKYFPTLSLMTYFIFDADDILKKFEEDRAKTIKENIDKIVGVRKLDDMIEALERVITLYESDINNIEINFIDDVSEGKLNDLETDLKSKNKKIEELGLEIKKLNDRKDKLFEEKSPSPQIEEFSKLISSRDNLQKRIKEINEDFLNHNILQDLDLIFLEDILSKIKNNFDQKNTSNIDFENATTLIRSTISEKYSGVVFESNSNIKLLKSGIRFNQSDLENIELLNLDKNKSDKIDVITILRKYNETINSTKASFLNLKEEAKKTNKLLIETMISIEQIGENTQNKELLKKFKEFKQIEEDIDSYNKLIDEIIVKIKEDEKSIEDIKEKLQINKESKEEISEIKSKIKITKVLYEITKSAHGKFLKDLFEFLNVEASNFLRNVVIDSKRFHTIEIDNEYNLIIKKSNGEVLENRQVNRGTIQMAMMAFFFGLSRYIKKKIPYVIDNPIIRLDTRHDRMLIEQLSKMDDQLIFHLIPGREYLETSFEWLKPYINTQNWINRESYKNSGFLISRIEHKDSDIIIDYSY